MFLRVEIFLKSKGLIPLLNDSFIASPIMLMYVWNIVMHLAISVEA